MRLAHLTDLHVQTAPRLGELFNKRLVGTANLYLLGRKAKFSHEVQQAAVQAALDARPDAVVLTGDLSAQGLPAEFEAARALLDPILSRLPTAIIAGNHDVYVREEAPGAAMRAVFGPWMGPAMPNLRALAGVHVLSVETCRPHPLSQGWTDLRQLAEADRLLAEAGHPPFLLLLHYPLRDRRGQPYGPWTRNLQNADAVLAWLARTPGVRAVLHGHEHHGFRTEVPTLDGPAPMFDPGASGYARLPSLDRTAHFNVYEVDAAGVQAVERYAWDGSAFRPEAGGAYASGR
jgi:3',5'-cyclic AMP phosphodiesterase CpdA